MVLYLGDRTSLWAEDVKPGHRLVHQAAPTGWVEVRSVEERPGGLLVVHFDDGRYETFRHDDLVWAVS